ncbi:MAG: hypothetical protein PVJ19_07910, partial [Desulfobacteraceae bacterium]
MLHGLDVDDQAGSDSGSTKPRDPIWCLIFKFTLSLQKSLGLQSQGDQGRSRSKLLRVLGSEGS